MKKLLVIMVAAVALAFGSVQHVSAQNDNGGLGVRLGGGDLLGAELSYLTKVDADNRWELDLGVGHEHVESRKYQTGHQVWHCRYQELNESAQQHISFHALQDFFGSHRETAQADDADGDKEHQ